VKKTAFSATKKSRVLAAIFFATLATTSRAEPDASVKAGNDDVTKLLNLLTGDSAVAKNIIDIYRSSFANMKPFLDDLGIDFTEAAAVTKKQNAATTTSANTSQQPSAPPMPATAAYHSPLGESHIQPSGPLNGAHLDGYVPMAAGLVVTSPTREDIARRTEAERANIEAVYFYRALRDQQAKQAQQTQQGTR
jgi:hypothetical protein